MAGTCVLTSISLAWLRDRQLCCATWAVGATQFLKGGTIKTTAKGECSFFLSVKLYVKSFQKFWETSTVYILGQ